MLTGCLVVGLESKSATKEPLYDVMLFIICLVIAVPRCHGVR